MVKVKVSRPVKLASVSCSHLFSLPLKLKRDCATCKGSGSIAFWDRLVDCRQCHGTGGHALLRPERIHHTNAYYERPHNLLGGRARITKNLTITVPLCMRNAMPFHPEDFVTFKPVGNALEISKSEQSVDHLYSDWQLYPTPELLSLVSLGQGDRLHLRISGEVLLIEKVPQQPEYPAPEPEPVPRPMSTPLGVLNGPGDLVIAPILRTD